MCSIIEQVNSNHLIRWDLPNLSTTWGDESILLLIKPPSIYFSNHQWLIPESVITLWMVISTIPLPIFLSGVLFLFNYQYEYMNPYIIERAINYYYLLVISFDDGIALAWESGPLCCALLTCFHHVKNTFFLLGHTEIFQVHLLFPYPTSEIDYFLKESTSF